MIARFHAAIVRFRRRFSRSEWAIRRLGLSVVQHAGEKPGLLLIQIDGLSRSRLTEAVNRGYMPFVKRLLTRHHYQMRPFYSGLPSTTPAVQGELHYGVKTAVPAFAYWDREDHRLVKMYWPEQAKKIEARCAAKGEGLLRGGSSWSNIYTGGAEPLESHFCLAGHSPGDLWRNGKVRSMLVFAAVQLSAVLRILALLAMESFIGFGAACRGILQGQNPLLEFGMILSRSFVGVGAREIITLGAKIDVTRGLPIIHANFVGYDEHAHRRGPRSLFALWALRGIDRAIHAIAVEAMRSSRRDYSLWIFSDHGQERARPYNSVHPEALAKVLFGAGRTASTKISTPRGPLSTWRTEKKTRGIPDNASHFWEDENYAFAGLGPVGHLYLKKSASQAERRLLAARLVAEGGVPGVLVKGEAESIVWIRAKGEVAVPDGVASVLPHAEDYRQEIANDLADLARHPDAGDIVLLGWSPDEENLSFAHENGSHAGPGPEETGAFLLVPSFSPQFNHSRLVRPAMLREAALQLLGRIPPVPPVATSETPPVIRVATYNAHGCLGLDGRTSPRRIARVLQELGPDIVALQEVDLGRRRSRLEDQASLIAGELGLHLTFCPTVTLNEEHYGHALLTRWPAEVVNRSRLPMSHRRFLREHRSALWVKVAHPLRPFHVIATHLGLSPSERMSQVDALLGENWLGRIPAGEPVLLCGDLNCTPRSRPYRRLRERLGDTLPEGLGISTFTSILPLLRLDHVLGSDHFSTRAGFTSRSDLAQVASDHLPLLVELELASASHATPGPHPVSSLQCT